MKQAEEKIQVVDDLFQKSDLPDNPDPAMAELQLVEIREIFYEGQVK